MCETLLQFHFLKISTTAINYFSICHQGEASLSENSVDLNFLPELTFTQEAPREISKAESQDTFRQIRD